MKLTLEKTERQCARRMFEHGAPKDMYHKQLNTDDDDDDNNSKTNDVVPRAQTTTRTTNRVEQIDDRNPPLRRSSRIRNKMKKVVDASTNPTIDRKIEQTTEFEKEREDQYRHRLYNVIITNRTREHHWSSYRLVSGSNPLG